MARDDTGGDAGKTHHTSRRAVLKAAGVTTLAIASGGVATAQTDQTVVDLGNEGLTDGDSIDGYLETHLTDGVEVRIPAGRYQFTGAGLAGEYADASLVGSSDGVELARPDGSETTATPTVTATGGTVRIENITVTGASGPGWAVAADAGASVHLLNVNFPDGSTSPGVAAQGSHAGLLWVKSCHFGSFSKTALDAATPAGDGDGRVVVDDATFVNTGPAAIRAGSDDSVVRGCYFEASAAAPAGDGQRGIEIPAAGTGLTVADCDFNWGGPGGAVVDFAGSGQGGSGVLRDLRVGYGDQDRLFTTGWDIEAGWTGESINVSEA